MHYVFLGSDCTLPMASFSEEVRIESSQAVRWLLQELYRLEWLNG